MDEDLFWVDKLASEVIAKAGKKKICLVASGVTPSGTIHIGNLREVITPDMVRRALVSKGVKVNHLHFWDNFDRFRKVPANVPQTHEKYIGMRVSNVPDPFGCHESYGKHFEKEFEEAAEQIGINPTYMDEFEVYKSCKYKDEIKIALNNVDKIKEALNKFRREELEKSWYPVEIYCEKCKKDSGHVTSYDGKYTIKYSCSCGNSGEVDFSKDGDIVKLRWRTNWAMRWHHYDIDFEPAGKEHSSPGGSRDTAKIICEEVYKHTPPVYQMYEFVIGKGVGGKLSGSKGAPAVNEICKIYLPEVVRFLYARTRPRTEFSIPIGEDEIFKVYEDFYLAERAFFEKETEVNERRESNLKRIYEMSVIGKVPKKIPVQLPFKYLVILSQFYDKQEEIVAELVETGHINAKNKKDPRIEQIIQKARTWAEKYAPEEYRYILCEEKIREVDEKEKEALKLLIKNISKIDENGLYSIGKESGLRGEFFKLCYNLLLKKDKGPRLIELIDIIGREKVRKLFERYL